MPLITSLSFDATVTTLFAPLVTGRAVCVLPDQFDIARTLPTLGEYGPISAIKATPAHLQAWSGAAVHPVSKAPPVTVVVGGEQLSSKLARNILHRDAVREIVNEYGPTEATVGCITYSMRDADGVPEYVPIGRPIANARIYILDRRRQAVPVGVTGEIYIGGPGVARGYLGDTQMTSERFVEDTVGNANGRIYRTGDLARYRADGNIEFIGRIDPQLQTERQAVEAAGMDTERWYQLEELVTSDDVYFCATGITTGLMLEGVERTDDHYKVQTLMITGATGERQVLTTYLQADRVAQETAARDAA